MLFDEQHSQEGYEPMPMTGVRKPHRRGLSLVIPIRHRPLLRNIFYGVLVLGCLYYLYPSRGIAEEERQMFKDEGPQLDLSPEEWAETAKQVREAFKHAYHGYEKYAAPHDELKPLTNRPRDNFNGWGVSFFDSLDTMVLMGLQPEFERAVTMVHQTNFTLSEDKYAPYFETVIRYLGGLLSAHALSGNKLLLERADELATLLDPVFNTTAGLAKFEVNPTTKRAQGTNTGVLAEIGTLQMEYTYLAKLTGSKQHYKRAETWMNAINHADLRLSGGMLPVHWNLTDGQPERDRSLQLSVGAQADSAHEYLLKQHLMTARSDKASLEMYLRATTYIISKLFYLSPTRKLLYVTDHSIDNKGRPFSNHVFEHLSCFLPGLFALGAHTLPLNDLESLNITPSTISHISYTQPNGHVVQKHLPRVEKEFKVQSAYGLKELHMWAAEGLAQTCYLTYADMPTGLGPDEMWMRTTDPKTRQGEPQLWMEALSEWGKKGRAETQEGLGESETVPPGVDHKRPVVHKIDRDYAAKRPGYLLRPETIESLFILWKVTGDPKWRLRGKRIFDAIENQTKTSSGYASLKHVESSIGVKDDDMPSYFLAETLKYLYLMFIDEDPIPLDKYVFNTEAHPFPVFQWTTAEKETFGL